jgi:hypothetical protein
MTAVIARALVVLLLLLAPSLAAHAHDRYSHPQAAVQHDANVSDAESLSQPCPRVPGRLCCCGSVVALPGGATVPVVDCGSWRLASAVAASADNFQKASGLHRVAPLSSQGRPRAPPLSS